MGFIGWVGLTLDSSGFVFFSSWLGFIGCWNGAGSSSVKVARMYSMGRAKDSSGFVLLFKLAQLGRAKDSSGFVFLLTLARTHSFGRVQDSSGFV